MDLIPSQKLNDPRRVYQQRQDLAEKLRQLLLAERETH